MRDFTRRCRGAIQRFDHAAVSQDGDAVGVPEDFVHLVRDVNDRHTLFSQSRDDSEKSLDFGFGQRARRFIHDQDSSRWLMRGTMTSRRFGGPGVR